MDERITSMIPHYGKLNKIYTEIMSGGSFSFEKQQFISGFYGCHAYQDVLYVSLRELGYGDGHL